MRYGSMRDKRIYSVQKIIRSLPQGASSSLQNLDPEIPFFGQKRPCDFCGKTVLPKNKSFPLVRFCDTSCSTKWWMQFQEFRTRVFTKERSRKSGEGRRRFLLSGTTEAERQRHRVGKLKPMLNSETRKRVSEALRNMNHRPPIQGGNGRPMPIPQARLLAALGKEWLAEYPVATGHKGNGFPTCYKIDIANPAMKIAIEVDGFSHASWKAVERDRKKDQLLTSFGWIVLRFTNQQVLNWIDSGMPMENSIFMTFRRHGIRVLALEDCSSTTVQ